MASSKQALWAAGHDEAVAVNQRDLINKILARYSGEFTVFRELLQNADDAEARSVEIRFETGAYLSRENGDCLQSDNTERGDLPDLKTAAVHQWTFKNNGIPFRDQDWDRLKTIAEGNPDEEKIGAFGVGFYSSFSITEDPWVSSGGQWMSFYWKDKKNQLYVRRGTMPASVDDVVDPWTTIQMTLREPGPIPPALDLTRFLVSSITFMTHLSEVSVYFDDKRLVRLSKDRGALKEVPMLNGLKGTSPKGLMNVKSIKTTPLHIEAEVVRWVYDVCSEKPFSTSRTDTLETATHQTNEFFSPPSGGCKVSSTVASMLPKEQINLSEATSSKIIFTIFAANVDVKLDDKLTGNLLRSTLKKPPSQLCYELIYTGKEEYDSGVNSEEEAAYTTGSVFQRLRADLEGNGSARVFIGHSTGQTTGIGGHMASRFIPTVERESIDLVDRNVSVWNNELLYVGGFLARSVYEFELDAIKKLWDSATAVNEPGGVPDEEVQTRLRGRALHALKFFTFYPSTPSPVVSNLMEAAFFGCATTHPFSIISSEGVRNSSQVFIPDPEFSGFLKHLPVTSDDIVNGAKTMIAALRSRGMIKNIMFVDILDELRLRSLPETEMIACLKWWIGVAKQGKSRKFLQERSRLLNALVSITGPPKKIMKLSNAEFFLNGSIIPSDGPLPSTVLPMSITGSFDPHVLKAVFSWTELSIIDWFRYVTNQKVASANAEFDITHSARWAERVFSVLAQAWPSLGKREQGDVIQILSPKSCIPTSIGLKKPDQAYFPSVNIFRDLPIVTFPSGGALEEVLQSLGVRKRVELQIIFDRSDCPFLEFDSLNLVVRVIETGNWTTFDFVKYLVSIRSTLTVKEIKRLQEIPAFLVEGTVKEELAAGTTSKIQRYRAKDLYEPIDFFRKLGLPIMDWGANNQWRPGSDEAEFVFSLGLKKKAPLTEVVNFMIRMVAIGDWTTFDLVKYLLSARSTLTVSGMRRLSEIPMFPKEGAGKEQSADIGSEVQLYRAEDLYEPVEIFRELGLPIIDWGANNQWRPESDEAEFVFSLGLKKKAPLTEVTNSMIRMVVTGNWTTFDLVKYLVSARSTLTTSEIGDLKEIPAFQKEGTGKEQSADIGSEVQLYKAKDLYEPVEIFRELGLPIIEWGFNNQWRPESDEAEFILSLGLKIKAPLTEVTNSMIRMIATGNWTTFDLVKYLVSARSTLTASEIKHLNEIPAFLKEVAGKEQSPDVMGSEVQLYKANDLYEPVEIFREFSLPIIDWGADNDWRPQSNEAKFLFSLGLKRGPPLPDILQIAASDNLSMRTKALSFFLDNLSTIYSNFDPQHFRDLAFVPAIVGSAKVLAKPLELYRNPEWAALGFAVVDPTLDDTAARKLKLNKHPPTSHLTTLLWSSPGDEVTARQWFEILAGRVSDFTRGEQWGLLRIPFVPVKSTGDKDIIKRLQPNQCFLGAANSELYSKLFAFVDFGARANVFLEFCGARKEPSDEDIIQILLAEPRRIYDLDNGRDHYLLVLRNLAANKPRIKLSLTSSSGSNMLLGTRRGGVKKDGGKASCEGSQSDRDFQDDFLQPNKVVIVDDINAYRLFGDRIFCAPQENIIEELYFSLGSPRLSSLVREDYKTAGEVPYSKIGAETRHLILERLPLFLYEHPRSRIEVSLDWLNKEKNFVVRVFRKLLVTKVLQHGEICISKSYEASAVAKRERKGPIELWLVENKQVNMYEISTSLCRIIFKSPKANDAMSFMTILSTGLKVLKQWGYNVDRILPLQKAERKAAEKAEREEAENAICEGIEKILITQTNIPLPAASTVIAASGKTGLQRTLRHSRATSGISEIPELGRPLHQNHSEATLSQPVSPPIVTSLGDVANNIEMAINACAPERSDLLRNREEMLVVLESLDEGYCHVTRKTGDLDLQVVGSMGDTEIFAGPDLPESESESLIQRKHDVLARFIHILKLLSKLYNIPRASLQIFADKEGQLISLNRGGCLAMNLRYFEAWHDLDVQQGDFSDALIYWYFMLAHGIAHNLVFPHNSEHEFYVSAICKAYLKPLFNLLSTHEIVT